MCQIASQNKDDETKQEKFELFIQLFVSLPGAGHPGNDMHAQYFILNIKRVSCTTRN